MRSMKENYSIISEQVKLIRENVDYLCQQQDAQTILITSGESGLHDALPIWKIHGLSKFGGRLFPKRQPNLID